MKRKPSIFSYLFLWVGACATHSGCVVLKSLRSLDVAISTFPY